MSEDVQKLIERLRTLAVCAAEAPEFNSESPAFYTATADAIERLSAEVAAHEDALRQHVRGASQRVADRDAQVREAFLAGYHAHPEAEAPVFTWSFAHNPLAGDRAEHCWTAWLATRQPKEPA